MNENQSSTPEFLALGNGLLGHAIQIEERLEQVLKELRGGVPANLVDTPAETPPVSLSDYLHRTETTLSFAQKKLDEIQKLV